MHPAFTQQVNFAPTFSNMWATQATTPLISESVDMQAETGESIVDANIYMRRYLSTISLHAVTAVEADVGPPLKKRIVELPEGNCFRNSGSAFAALNTDVHEHIISWLPTSSLAALMATCHYFSDVSLKPLCRRSRQLFESPSQLSSFLCFLRAGTAYPRWPLIQELNICLDREQGGEEQDGFNALLRIVYLCRGLRRIRLGVFLWRGSEMDFFAQVVSELPLLEDLRMPLSSWTTTPFNIRKLLRSKLRTLSVYHDNSESFPTYDLLKDMTLLPSTLMEMHLPDVTDWKIPTGATLTCLQRLTIGMPRQITSLLGLKDAFPNLRHLTVTDRGSPTSHCFFHSNIESARVEAGKQWALHPRKWPTLAVLETDQSRTPYSPDIPENFYHMRTAVADAQPVCLEFGVSLSCYRISGGVAVNQKIYDFSFIHASRRLKRCVVNVKERATTCYLEGRPSSQISGHWAIIDGLVQTLSVARSSLTHLLVKYLPDQDGDFVSGAYLRESTAFENGVKKTAILLANASPTLQWVGIYFQSCSLRSFVIKRDFISTEGGLTLEEVSEVRGWAIMKAEEMSFVRCVRSLGRV
ncbi:hypothetical protein C8Q79DRAFT_1014262 [Trametes meyenii]|nr:hypothetical protein C8Q79DRAFT_1014262 [Trametes meyenii]